ncbi:MAG: VWA domain-containing protein [Candidatus Riflebacteria bacterium]|nr:VWA domain-containing protein [Candidatus Riflebacteria bacterium]
MKQLVFEPVMPVGGILGLLLLGVAALVAYHAVRPPAASERCRLASGCLTLAGFLVLVCLLFDPTWLETIPPPAGRPVLHVLLDTSASMGVADVAGRSRLDVARDFALAVHSRMTDPDRSMDVRLRTFDRHSRPVSAGSLASVTARGEVTDLASAIRDALGGWRLEAILVLTDGIHNATAGTDELTRAARAARSAGVPIHAWSVGGEASVADVGVELDAAEELAFVGQEMSLPVRIVHRGLGRGTVQLSLARGGQRIESRLVELVTGRPTVVELALDARKAGTFDYTISVAPVSGEVTLANNACDLVLRVLDQPIRLLVLEGKPYWDLKFLVRCLKLDPAVRVTWAVRLTSQRAIVRSTGQDEGTTSSGPRRRGAGETGGEGAGSGEQLPEHVRVVTSEAGAFEELIRSERLERYSVVVLGRDADAFPTPPVVEALKSWVSRQGGALLCARGRPTTVIAGPMESLLPVHWENSAETRFGFDLTEQGRALRLVPERLLVPLAQGGANLVTGARATREKELARVLARASGTEAVAGMPVLTVQPYGLGRSVVLEGTGMWRFALSPAVRAEQESVYRSFWSSLLRWIVVGGDLLPGQRVVVRPARWAMSTIERCVLHVVARADAPFSPRSWPVIELQGPGGKIGRHPAAPAGEDASLYRVDLGSIPAGRYRARVTVPGSSPAECAFVVAEPLQERLEISARPDLLALLARETGGTVLGRPDPGALLDMCHRYWASTNPVRYRRRPAWDSCLVLIAVVGAWSLAWLVRRLGGLV